MSSTINHLVANGQGYYRIQIHMTNKTTGSPNENDTSVGPQLIVFQAESAKTNQEVCHGTYTIINLDCIDPGYDAHNLV